MYGLFHSSPQEQFHGGLSPITQFLVRNLPSYWLGEDLSNSLCRLKICLLVSAYEKGEDLGFFLIGSSLVLGSWSSIIESLIVYVDWRTAIAAGALRGRWMKLALLEEGSDGEEQSGKNKNLSMGFMQKTILRSDAEVGVWWFELFSVSLIFNFLTWCWLFSGCWLGVEFAQFVTDLIWGSEVVNLSIKSHF